MHIKDYLMMVNATPVLVRVFRVPPLGGPGSPRGYSNPIDHTELCYSCCLVFLSMKVYTIAMSSLSAYIDQYVMTLLTQLMHLYLKVNFLILIVFSYTPPHSPMLW